MPVTLWPGAEPDQRSKLWAVISPTFSSERQTWECWERVLNLAEGGGEAGSSGPPIYLCIPEQKRLGTEWDWKTSTVLGQGRDSGSGFIPTVAEGIHGRHSPWIPFLQILEIKGLDLYSHLRRFNQTESCYFQSRLFLIPCTLLLF